MRIVFAADFYSEGMGYRKMFYQKYWPLEVMMSFL